MNSRSIADFGIRCVFAFVVLVSIEVLLRILDIPALKTERTELSEAHPYFGWTPRPGLVERMWWRDYWYELSHSEQGLRGTGLVAAQRPAGIKNRVLMLGDSVLYGLGASDAEVITEILKQKLPTTEIVNTGTPGYGRYDPAINTYIEASLAAVCAELGIEYVDLLPPMQVADQKSAAVLYYERDNHLTPAGNAVVADIIEPILAKYLQ
jgi:hypothetical protein